MKQTRNADVESVNCRPIKQTYCQDDDNRSDDF